MAANLWRRFPTGRLTATGLVKTTGSFGKGIATAEISNAFFEAPSGPSNQTLTQASRFDNSNTFYAALITPPPVTLTAGLVTNSNTLFTATETNSIGLVAARVDNVNTYFAATVTPEVRALVASLVTNNTTFYVPVLGIGAINLQSALVNNTQVFFTAGVGQTAGGVNLVVSRFDNSNSFFSPTATVGVVNLSETLVVNDSSFFTAAANTQIGLTGSLVVSANVFFAATLYMLIWPDPTTVKMGVQYGPTGNDYTGTYIDNAIKLDITTGKLVKPLSSTLVMSI